MAGSLKSKGIVPKYEMRAACAQKLFSISTVGEQLYEASLSLVQLADVVHDVDPNADDTRFSYEAILYRGDATNWAVGENKLHLSDIAVLALSILAQRSGNAPSYHYAIPEVQEVLHGSTDELEAIIQKEFASVGVPTLADRLNQAHLFVHRKSMFYLGLDRGPDNTGWAGRIRRAARRVPNISYFIRWCMAHGIHLTTFMHYVIMNAWKWGVRGGNRRVR